MANIEKHWYRPSPWRFVAAPLTLLFWAASALRRLLFRVGIQKSERIGVPVVVVGNISVGGNGKTPLVIRLCQLLKQQGYRPGVLSRGYGGKSDEYPLTVVSDTHAEIAGDEPVLMKQHLACPLVVDPNRVRGAKDLVENHGCDVIVCDDGLQHYKLARDIEIAVMDGQRRLGNGWLLPSGPLREGRWRLETVDFVIINGGVAERGEHLMSLESGQLVNVKAPQTTKSVNDIHGSVVAAAGIGNPERFFTLLASKRVKLKSQLDFADHHQYKPGDLPNETVLMTEKDAVKCRHFAEDDWWYLPVTAKLTEDFKQQLLQKLKNIKTRT